jgi:SAM-dependent methyltransferase
VKAAPEIRRLRPWYHDFSGLGLRTDFEGGVAGRWRRLADAWSGEGRLVEALRPGPPPHRRNQEAKERALRPLLDAALGELPAAPACLDLFCSDGYYACLLATLAPGARVLAVDRDAAQLERGRAAAEALGLAGVAFHRADVSAFVGGASREFDLVLCLGGLYHLADPRALLARLARICRGLLLVQSAVTLATEDPRYFVAPAPGWRHGSRFTDAALAGWLEELEWRTLVHRRHELPGNRRASDRGSSVFLCRAPAAAHST